MKKFFQTLTEFFVAVIILVTSLNFANAAENLPVGAGVYQLEEPTGINKDPINVYYYRPKNWKNGDKIFVAFHGSGRNAQGFAKNFQKSADEKNLLLICPEFTKTKYPGTRYYNFGNVMRKNNTVLVSNKSWTFNAVNRIIDDVKERTGATKSKIIFFGHSAGGQFMHRYVFFADEIKADLIIAANAGMYIMPDENITFPHGFKNSPTGQDEMKRAFKKNVIIMVGEKDIVPPKGSLQSAAANRQGLNRFERGKNFFAQCKEKASAFGAKFNWRLVTVPNVGHNSLKMAKNALKYI